MRARQSKDFELASRAQAIADVPEFEIRTQNHFMDTTVQKTTIKA